MHDSTGNQKKTELGCRKSALRVNKGEPGNTTGVAGLDCMSRIMSSPIQGAPKGNVNSWSS